MFAFFFATAFQRVTKSENAEKCNNVLCLSKYRRYDYRKIIRTYDSKNAHKKACQSNHMSTFNF